MDEEQDSFHEKTKEQRDLHQKWSEIRFRAQARSRKRNNNVIRTFYIFYCSEQEETARK